MFLNGFCIQYTRLKKGCLQRAAGVATQHTLFTALRGLKCLPSTFIQVISSRRHQCWDHPSTPASAKMHVYVEFVIFTANPKLRKLCDLTAYCQHLMFTVLSNAFMWEETETALISDGSLNAMTHIDRNIKALLCWYAFDSFDTFTYQFQEKKRATKHQLCRMILWFWITKESHQCCSAAVVTFSQRLQTSVNDGVFT